MDIDKILQALAQRLSIGAAQARKAFTLDPFTYVINLLPIAASVTGQGEFITTADAGFAICKSTCTVASAAEVYIANISDVPRYAPLTLTLSEAASGRDLSNAPVAINNYFGSAQEPFIWNPAKIIDPSSTLSLRANNLVATAFNVRFAFHGYKIFGQLDLFKQTR